MADSANDLRLLLLTAHGTPQDGYEAAVRDTWRQGFETMVVLEDWIQPTVTARAKLKANTLSAKQPAATV